jgi:4-hydroxythreonine-4-phosphate dehydrogenase
VSALKARLKISPVLMPSRAAGILGTIDIMEISDLRNDHIVPGRPTVKGGRAMAEYIIRAVELIRKGELDAMVTCPISKALMHQAGYRFDGHTQLIAHLTDTDDYIMMLAGERLKVCLVTIHHALREVPGMITEDRVYKTIFITANALAVDFDINSPKIAVAALNPHAGEEGLFGTEEQAILEAINKAKSSTNMDIYGPLSPDTVYYRAVKGEFDVVISMYHDQGLIPLKLLHFSDAVNITLGLPIVRTSVDHGTAYDIAGTGKADPSSLKSAIEVAVMIAKNRKKKFLM